MKLDIVASNKFRKDLKLVEPDWLLIYRQDEDVLELFLFRTGSHSDLF